MGGHIYVTRCNDSIEQGKQGSLTASYMPKTNKNCKLCPFRGKLDFEDLLILEKTA